MTTRDTRPVAIVIAEGSELIRMLTADALTDAGYDTIAVNRISDVLVVLRERSDVRVLITGRSVQADGDGITLTHLVHDGWPGVRLLVTSGGSGDLLRILPPETRLLRKPFDGDALVCAVNELVPAIDGEASVAPVLPEGLPLQAGSQLGSGAGTIAAPAAEPDKT